MEFVADLHIHSHLSRATAKNLNLEHINLWAQLKGITVVGTGDFTHPQWFAELSEKLEPAEDGLFRLKPEHVAGTADTVPNRCQRPVRFILTGEISSIYKKDGKTRKVHNVVFAPTLELAERLSQRLGKIGNIASDGRPILGLDCKALLEMVLETSEDAFLIPAHIWTPWFSVLGSKSGFDSVEACFEDLTPYIFAVETGLSSDPAMNWRVSSLDRFALVSNSDAHSPANLGREANLFDTELSYVSIRDALKSGDPHQFLGTLEYFAEEGKYHFDGHRKCGARLSPTETIQNKGCCPVCGKPVTIGVLNRVEELADRKAGDKPQTARPYTSLLPLTDILAEVFQVGAKSKKVTHTYHRLLEKLGSEFDLLRKVPLTAIEKHGPPLLAEGVSRMRSNQVHVAPGYDGEFGKISLFDEEERSQLLGQRRLFGVSGKPGDRSPQKPEQSSLRLDPASRRREERRFLEQDLRPHSLNKAQQEAVEHAKGPLLIVAGPGTGKTLTLAHRIAYLLLRKGVQPGEILAVTFTNKAAGEMADRLARILGNAKLLKGITIKTLHAFCLDILRHETDLVNVRSGICLLNEKDRTQFVKVAIQRACGDSVIPGLDVSRVSDLISRVKQHVLAPGDKLAGSVPEPILKQFSRVYETYQAVLYENRLLDFDDLVFQAVKLFEADQATRRKYQERFRFIFIDEYQDINYAQYRLIRLLAPAGHDICVIGDPDQAIYGFRGADVTYFHRFCEEYPEAKTIRLSQNYRSTETILRASGQLIGADGAMRTQEALWSGIQGAKTLTVVELPTQRAEAEYIVKTIDQEIGGIAHFSMDSGRVARCDGEKERSFSDFAVLYRVREQGKALEEAFRRSGIPFQIVGNEKLQDRNGIRELVSYLRVGCSLASDFDIERILNFPARGIGRATAGILKQWSNHHRYSMMTALERADDIPGLKPGLISKLKAFSENLHQLPEVLHGMTVHEQIHKILTQFGFLDALDGDRAFKEDLSSLLDLSKSFGDQSSDLLARLTLERAQDCYNPGAEKVVLMTIHAAKGLEFPVVFVAGCEDGLIPYRREGGEHGDLLEERRLFYVALTRAQEKIYLTHAKKRLWFGKRILQRISPFLAALEEDLKEYQRPELSLSKSRSKKADIQLSLFEM